MTYERAIELLRRLQDEQFDGIHGDERREALSMAVRALEQNLGNNGSICTKGDTIYRQEAIDIVRNRVKRFTTACVLAVTEIEKLPSAQPQRILYANMSDAEFEKWLYEHGICNPNIHESIPCDAVPLLIDNAISELPSAQPEKTCCGYDVTELIGFAIACRRAGVDEKDLKTFAQDCEFAWRVMQEEFESKIREAFEKWTGGKSDAD